MKGTDKELKGQLRKKLTTDMKGTDKELKGQLRKKTPL